MYKIKKGDIVGRKSYGKDIIFTVSKIIYVNNKKIAILNGLIERIKADSEISDLELIEKEKVKEFINIFDKKIDKRIKQAKEKNDITQIKEGLLTRNSVTKEKIVSGKILHLDGDKKYSEKSLKYYKKMGIRAVVKNIPENKQPKFVYNLLKIYQPDILVITGHDSMIRKEKGYYYIYNYRNSRFFLSTVLEARRYERDTNSDLVIFAGACQSYFEALIQAGANFASSPAKILIDILDPLIVAKEVATTDNFKYVRIEDIENKL